MENGGKWGSRFAPTCILNALKQFHLSEHQASKSITPFDGLTDFQTWYGQHKNFWLTHQGAPLFHLGGGHDQLYPFFSTLLAATQSTKTRWLLINLDAHTDTREELNTPHSGNPISRLALQFADQLKVWQVGIHPWANSIETLQHLSEAQQKITYFDQGHRVASDLDLLKEEGWVTAETQVFLSVDLDALAPPYAQGVSAVNSQGLSPEFVYKFFKMLKEKLPRPLHAVGFYEYNPLYDNLHGLGAKVIAQMLYSFF